MKNFYSFFLLTFSILIFAQVSTDADQVMEGINFQNQVIEKSIVGSIRFENIGPSIMIGRVSDLEVNPKNPKEFYVAYASGGLWYTNNNGNTFDPIFDNANTQNIGDFAVDWENNIIIVGTGENNSSRSSYAGIGILKSSDNGKNWENIGLTDSHHIGKIKINPKDSNEIVVGVLGHLYSKNSERGIFKTINGGKTWDKTLYIDDNTGIIDLDIDPMNFNIQFASSWERDRTPWNFNGNGKKSAIYKSIDAGETWGLISDSKSGFPNGKGTGRIGISVYDINTIYAIVDNQFRRPPKKEKKKNTLDKNSFKEM